MKRKRSSSTFKMSGGSRIARAVDFPPLFALVDMLTVGVGRVIVGTPECRGTHANFVVRLRRRLSAIFFWNSTCAFDFF